MNTRTALGKFGEEAAVRSLRRSGLRIVARNWRCGRAGEVDIVALDGDTLVICEVKTRKADGFEHPMAAVRGAKVERLRRLAELWLSKHGGAPQGGVRIDLVGVLVPRCSGQVEIEHARGVG